MGSILENKKDWGLIGTRKKIRSTNIVSKTPSHESKFIMNNVLTVKKIMCAEVTSTFQICTFFLLCFPFFFCDYSTSLEPSPFPTCCFSHFPTRTFLLPWTTPHPTFYLFIFPISLIPALCSCLLKFHSVIVRFVV